MEKAIENWVRVTTLNPDHVMAHSRLALTHEQLGHIKPAIAEYLAVASLLQRAGNPEKTAELINKALTISPDSVEARAGPGLVEIGTIIAQACATKRRDGADPHGAGEGIGRAAATHL